MEELQLALERRRTELEACHASQMAGQERFAARILPVFYDAKPEDVSAKIKDFQAAQARGMKAGEEFQRQAGRDLELLQQLLGASYQATRGGGQGRGAGPSDSADAAVDSSQCVKTLEGIGNISGIRACEVRWQGPAVHSGMRLLHSAAPGWGRAQSRRCHGLC
jgi:hypothetical protein